MQKLGSKKRWSIFWSLFFGVLLGVAIAVFLFNQGFFKKSIVIERPAGQSEAKRVYATASVEEDITSSRQNAIVKAAQKVGPTVVSISVVQVRVVRERVHFFLPLEMSSSMSFGRDSFVPENIRKKFTVSARV